MKTLDGNGFAVHWVVDANGAGDPDGSKQGDVTVLQGISQDLLDKGSPIIHSAMGDILARLANTEAANITQASFM